MNVFDGRAPTELARWLLAGFVAASGFFLVACFLAPAARPFSSSMLAA